MIPLLRDAPLFRSGWSKAGFIKQNKVNSAAMMLVNGGIAAGLAYGIGYIVQLITSKST